MGEIDISPSNLTMLKMLNRAAENFNAASNEQIEWGWHNKSVGGRHTIGTKCCWIHVSSHKSAAEAGECAYRLKNCNNLTKINKPQILDYFLWQEEQYYWLASVMSYREHTIC